MKLSDNFRSISLIIVGLAIVIMAGITALTMNNLSYYYIALCGLSFILSSSMVMNPDNARYINTTMGKIFDSLQSHCDKFQSFANMCSDGLHKVNHQFQQLINEDDIQIFNNKLQDFGHQRSTMEENCYTSYFEYIKELEEINTTSTTYMSNIFKRCIISILSIVVFLISSVALCAVGAYTGMINIIGVHLYFAILCIILFVQVVESVNAYMHYRDYRKHIEKMVSSMKHGAEVCVREFKSYCSDTESKANLMAILLGCL